jgi:putative Mg2+ transporter-C (MgtC) family protein
MTWESATNELTVLLRALVALFLGGLLGWERENAGKWAGLRTHMLVALASLIFISLGQMLIADTLKVSHQADRSIVQADPSRMIEAIVAGIAFLGAGTIFRDNSAGKARGLTTAASLLTTATIGIAVAIDRYVIAIGVTALCLITLHTLNRLSGQIHQSSGGEKGGATDSARKNDLEK